MTAPLRVMMLTARADVGGGPFHVDLLLKHLPPEVERWVACPDEPPYAPAWRALPAVRDVAPIPRRKFSIPALLRLAAFCRRQGVRVVHSHGKGAGLYSRPLKLLLPGVKVVHTFHGVHLGQYGPLMRAASLAAERSLRPFTDAFVNVSAGEKAQCVRLGLAPDARCRVIRNGIPPPVLPAPAPLPWPAGRRIVLTLARFEPQKNMALALEVAARAAKRHPDWLFVWAGDGPGRAPLERRAKELGLTNVLFLGFTDRGPALMAAADVFLSTSLWEGLPYALIEAAALGLPVVATRVVGNDEVVSDGRSGFLFPPEAPGQAMASLEEVLSNPALRRSLSDGARRIYQGSFTLAGSVDALHRLYRDVVGPVC